MKKLMKALIVWRARGNKRPKLHFLNFEKVIVPQNVETDKYRLLFTVEIWQSKNPTIYYYIIY